MSNPIYTDTKTKNSDNNIREQRMVSGFSRIKVSGDATLQVAQGDREWLIVEADGALMPSVVTEVVDGTLKLRLKDDDVRGISNNRRVHFFVGCKTLNAVSLSGSTAARIATLNTTELLCAASGSAYMEIGALEAERLVVKASGSVNLSVAGHVIDQTLHCSGALQYQAGQLGSKQAQLEVSGACEMTLWVEDLLDMRSASGACIVRYYGAPQVKQTHNFTTKLVALGQPKPSVLK